MPSRPPARGETPNRFTDITIRQLQYLVAVARTENLSAAARHCHVSQPALAEQIEKLETRLGKLVVRGHRRTTLTPLGTSVVEHAQAVLTAVAELERAARYPTATRLGMIETVGPYLFAPVLSASTHQVLPVQAQTSVLLDALEQHRIDAAVLAAGTYPPHLHATVLGTDPLLLAVPAGDPLTARRKRAVRYTLDDVRDREMLLLADGHCMRDLVDTVCRTARTEVAPFEAATVELLVEMVAAGLGVTLVPKLAAPAVARHPRVNLVELADPPARTLHLVSPSAPTGPLADIAALLVEQLTR